MSIQAMTFHESYGHLPKSTLRLVRKHNVSPADFDSILDSLMFKTDTPANEPAVPADWDDVNAFIVASSPDGYYRPSRYL